MRSCAAPEVRGSRRSKDKAQAGLTGLPVLLLGLCLAGSVKATSPADGSVPRQLLTAAARPTPSFVLPELAGAPLRLQERTGRIVLVHFFATWCEPCREELAGAVRLSLGRQTTRAQIEQAADGLALAWRQVHAGG